VVPGSSREERDLLSDPLCRELLAARLIANFATVNKDGTIHLVPLWFLWQAPNLLFPTNHATRKVRNLSRDPRATVMIDDSRGGFDLRGLTLVGEAVVDYGAAAVAANLQIHLKYLTDEGRRLAATEAYLATDDVTIRFTATRVSSWDLRGTPQGEAVKLAGGWRALD
jgi:PPOX class probable F420-dependent enzyme